MNRINIRAEQHTDYQQVYKVHQKAFGQEEEGQIVERIRKSGGFVPELSLVAEIDGAVVGHILFSKITIETKQGDKESLSLAPMAVLPDFQKQGIGGQMIKAGIQKAVELGFDSIIVLGHADYYPNFGFEKASKWKITCSFEVPDEAFMAIELKEDALANSAGKVVYPPAFNIE
ncbi:N-acetyltransferase [Gracilimonas sp.]|uniref:GNAT family N-acetyltransferase n=1 Tax=Gracilimonas sp. TaxID=1974203 RepID=UPI0032EEF1DE